MSPDSAGAAPTRQPASGPAPLPVTDEAAQDALKTIRSVTALLLVTYVLWFSGLQSMTGSLQHRTRIRQLLAWLHLRDLVARPEVAESLLAGASTVDKELGADGVARELTIQSAWPQLHDIQVTLHRSGSYKGVYAYEVRGNSWELPLDAYAVMMTQRGSRPCVIPRPAAWWSTEEAAVRAMSPSPDDWRNIRGALAAYGFNVADPAALELGRPDVERFTRDLRSGSVSVVGLSLDTTLFYVGLGCITVVVSFSLLGPILVLRGSRLSQISTSWTPIIAQNKGGICGLVASVAVLAVILLPLAVLVFQAIAWRHYVPIERWVLYFNFAGILATMVANGYAAAAVLLSLKRS